MDTLPLHPALVHLPLGIAFLLPLLGLGLVFSIWRGWLPRHAWVGFVIISAIALGTALAAKEAGEKDEERVAARVGQAAVERHAEAGEAFTMTLGVLTLLSAGALFLRREVLFRTATAAIALAYFGALGVGLTAGRYGGELVYKLGGVGPVPMPRLPTPDGTVPRQPTQE